MSSGKSNNASAQPQVAPPTYTSGAASTEQSQTWTPWANAAPAYDALAAQTNALAGQAPQWVGPSEQTLQGLQSMYGAIPGMNAANNTALQNYQALSNAADVANNPYVQGMVGVNAANVNKQLSEQWLPALTGGSIASGSGSMGSSRAGLAQGQAVGNAAQQLGQANAGLLNTAYGQGLAAQQSALSGLGALQQGMLAPAQAMAQAGQVMEGYEQNRLNAPWQQLQNIGAALQYTNPLGTLSGRGWDVSESAPANTWDPMTGKRVVKDETQAQVPEWYRNLQQYKPPEQALPYQNYNWS